MLRKLGTGLSRILVVAVAVGIAAEVWVPGLWAQTHIVLTTDQDFTVANNKYLSGIYECADGGYIDSSCIVGHFPEVSCPAGYAIQVISSGITPATCIAVGTGTPAGSDTYVQYNNMGVFGADQNLTWDYNNSIMHLGGAGPGEVTLGGDVLANLGTPSDGTLANCSNCTNNTSPCTTGGSGSIAQRINGAWICGAAPATATSVFLWIPTAQCNAGSAATLWDLPTSNPAVADCVVGTNTIQGTLDYADGANSLSAQMTLQLASNWNSSGSTDVQIRWFSTTTSGNVVWQVATACVATTESNDPSFNTASTVTSATQGSASRMNSATITGLTMTGCAAGEVLHVKVFRDPTNGSDTMAGTAQLVGVLMTFPKS